MMARTVTMAAVLAIGFSVAARAAARDMPVNTWVRVADTPSDVLGREVPPGRSANWAYVPDTGKFYRYGGYTPRYSNALDEFDPKTGAWRRLFADDENYPDDRPGGAAEALVTWDPQRKVVWIAGGMASGQTGALGIWKFDPKTGAFEMESPSVHENVRRLAFDWRRGLFVAAGGRNHTPVYSLETGKWESRRTQPSPEERWIAHWPLVYHEASGKIVLVKSNGEVWALDTEAFAWEQLHDGQKAPVPPSENHTRRVFTIAYEPQSATIMLHGGSDGGRDERFGRKTVWNDTWFFDLETGIWTEIGTPGPTPLVSVSRDKHVPAIAYRTALAYDSDRKAMTLSDPDLGVWAFRYAPGRPAGTEKAGCDEPYIEIGRAARERPPIPGPQDIFRETPPDLNPRIAGLPDNTAVSLDSGGFSGTEIPWDYDREHGMFVKYGGCNNTVARYWRGYGNDLSYYDPRTETFHVRRAGDVSGADRPGTGCTRSIVYDSHRKLFWFYGGASGAPGTPQAAGWPARRGTWAYSFAEDKFSFMEPDGESGRGPGEHNCYLVYDPHHRIIVAPEEGRTWVFDTRTAVWTLRDTPGSPSAMISNYTRLVYVRSLKGTLRVAVVPTGRTSAERPAEARSASEAAGNDTVFWKQIRKGGEWSEWTHRTLLYDHAAGDWRDLKPEGQPNFRNNKYGLAYDIVNDVVLLIGGNINWNGPVVEDIWAYVVRENAWVKLAPEGDAVPYGENLQAVYDPRHNATLIRSDRGNRIAAYRYKRGELPQGFLDTQP